MRALLGVVIDRSRDRSGGDLHGFMQFYGTSDSLAETSGQVDGRNRKSRFVKAIENWRCWFLYGSSLD